MATKVANPTTPRGRSKSPTALKKPLEDPTKLSSNPLVDNEGNVLPYPTYKVSATQEKYCQPSPIPRLAAAAAFKTVSPTAGGYAISRAKEPQVDFPPECLLYEDQPWVLGKMNPAALTDPEPEDVPVVEAIAQVPSEQITPVPAEAEEDVKEKSTAAPNTADVEKEVKNKPKSRNVSASPVRASRPIRGKSPRSQQQDKPKTTKSPGRSGEPASKLSPRTGAKKIVNAK